jgi:Mg2+-importing ATPase
LFDYVTFFVLLYVFHAWQNAPLFQTAWFVESLLTQTLIIHVIRSKKIPFIQTRASIPLMAATGIIMVVGVAITYAPFGASLGFVHLPFVFWPILFKGGFL